MLFILVLPILTKQPRDRALWRMNLLAVDYNLSPIRRSRTAVLAVNVSVDLVIITLSRSKAMTSSSGMSSRQATGRDRWSESKEYEIVASGRGHRHCWTSARARQWEQKSL